MTSSTRQYQGLSAEERAQARRRTLMDVGFIQMAVIGLKNMTIDQLCREAGLHKRYFYESFTDLDQLAAAIVDELATKLIELGVDTAQNALQQGLSTDAIARMSLHQVIDFLVSDRRRAKVLFSDDNSTPRTLSHRKQVIRRIADELSAFGHVFHNANDTHVIAKVGAALLIGGSIEALVGWLDGTIEMPLEQFIGDLAEFWVLVGMGAVTIELRRLQDKPGR